MRDVQFNPVSVYEFAAAFETGTIQVTPFYLQIYNLFYTHILSQEMGYAKPKSSL